MVCTTCPAVLEGTLYIASLPALVEWKSEISGDLKDLLGYPHFSLNIHLILGFIIDLE
jgi:hypothetical protein